MFAKVFLPAWHFPGKAVDVAGSSAKLRRPELPADATELQKRVRFIAGRHASSIENHEFEKARFYSKEEKKERENLRALMESYKINENATVPVTIDDIEAVIAQWTGATLDVIRKARQQTEEKNPPTA